MSLNRLTGAILLASSVLSASPLLVACTEETVAEPPEENPLAAGADFVAIPRDTDAASQAARQAKLGARALPPVGENKEFYLAIKKSAFKERWFLSAFLEQYYPGAVNAGAARTLGTRVVAFREQNGKLYVFDASNGQALDPVFDPTLLVEAYPIVKDKGFVALPGSGDYVLVDPAAGLNRFNVVSDAFAPAGYSNPVKFEVELSFLQRARSLEDGISYQQVFTGYTQVPNPDAGGETTVANQFQGSGTLNIALRKYKDTPGFTPATLADKGNYFFAGQDRHQPDGTTINLVNRWNIYPGMKPIKWTISAELPKYLEAHPELAGADVLGAVERGIESWNQVFGFPVFDAVVGKPGDAPGDDDKNFFLFDPGSGPGYAYANWRANPVTGEIRGAIVYLGSEWLSPFEDDAEEGAAAARPAVPALRWEGVSSEPLCNLHIDDVRAPLAEDENTSLTGDQKLSLYLQEVVAHEVGHNLGLRHNFKGSLLPPTSSVMEYNLAEVAFVQPEPGPYDHEAIGWLYGTASSEPSQPFCTDEDTWFDPECYRFDFGADPVAGYWSPVVDIIYDLAFDLNLYRQSWINYYVKPVAGAVLAGSPEQAAQAWETLFAELRAPIDPAVLAARPLYAAGVEQLTRPVLALIFDSEAIGSIYLPASASPVFATIVDDLGGALGNADGVRSYPTRRYIVDLLARAQTVEAYGWLLTVRAELVAAIEGGTLASSERLQSLDLVERIDSVTSPYFK